MFGYHKPNEKYPVASKIELISYAFAFFISAAFIGLNYFDKVTAVVPSETYVTYAFVAAASTFILGLIASIWMIEKKDE